MDNSISDNHQPETDLPVEDLSPTSESFLASTADASAVDLLPSTAPRSLKELIERVSGRGFRSTEPQEDFWSGRGLAISISGDGWTRGYEACPHPGSD